MKTKSKPLVTVVMITYNHEKYIKQAIEGVLMQKSNFDIELIISNDASPDNTDSVVKTIINNYKGKIKIHYYKHVQNKGISKNFAWALKRARGEYIAICEGDDYWTEPYKLQVQVDFLNNKQEYTLVGTLRSNLVHKTGKITKEKPLMLEYESYDFYDVVFGVRIATLTVMLRKTIVDKYLVLFDELQGKLSLFDYSIWIFASFFGKIALINEYTAVYRIISNSASRPKKRWDLKKNYFCDFLHIINYLKINDNIKIKESLYLRAKSFYLFACESNDKKACDIIYAILIENGDKKRGYTLKLLQFFPFLTSYFVHIDGYLKVLLTKKIF